MSDQSSLRSIIRVSVRARKAQNRVPRIRRTNNLRIRQRNRRNLRLGGRTSRLCRLIGIAYIGQLVADAVGDDVGVECFLLALVDERVDGLEGELGVGTPVEAGFEFHGWDAGAEVEAGDG